MKNQYLEAGKIVNTHGIAGELKIVHWCDTPDFLLQFDTLYVNNSPLTVTSSRLHKNNVLIKFDEITSINEAMKYKDKIIYIDRDDVTLPEEKNFLADLFGLEVKDVDTRSTLGVIKDILTPPSHPIYVVQGKSREWMIPAVDAFIVETNVAEGYIIVRLIEGM